MARFKYYRYDFDKKDESKLPIRGFVRIENGNTAVFERPLTPKEISKGKLKEHDDSKASALTRYRMAKGLTQFDLAKASGVPRNAVQRYEGNGIDTCTIAHAKKLAEALDVIVQDLID